MNLRLALLALPLAVACGPQPRHQPDGSAAVGEPRVTTLQARLSQPFSAAAAATVGDLIYLAGGLRDAWPSDGDTGNCRRGVSTFDPATGAIADAGRLPVANRGLGLVAVPGGDLISFMGYCGTNTIEETHVYALRDGGSSLLGTMPVGSFYFASGLLEDLPSGGHRLVTAGGYGSGPEREEIQQFDPVTGAASTLSVVLPEPRPLACGAVSGNRLYVFGGASTGVPPNPAATNVLSDEIVSVGLSPERADVVARLPEPLAGCCAVTRRDGAILLFGGARYVPSANGLTLEPSDAVLVFTPATMEVTASPARLPRGRAGLACAVTADDQVFLFGGADSTFAAVDEVAQFEPSPPADDATSGKAALRYRLGAGCSSAGGGASLSLALWALAWAKRRGRDRRPP